LSTDYDGLATATQAPSVPPTPGVVPTVSIPADGEALNVASITQAFKTLADFEAWLMSPRAKVSAWADPIFRYRSALLHTRSYIDHLGFISGRVVQWDEDWPYVGSGVGTFGPRRIDAFTGTAAAAPFDLTVMTALGFMATSLNNAGTATGVDADAVIAAVQVKLGDAGGFLQAAIAAGMGGAAAADPDDARGSWLIKGLQTSGSSQVAAYDPTAGLPRHRFVLIDAGDAIGDHAMLYRRTHSLYDEDLSFALEWEQYLGAGNMTGRNLYGGFCEPGVTPETASHFAVFKLGPTGTWRYVVRGGGAVVGADTGVTPVANWARMRVEFVGGFVADDGVRAARFYIDGALVGTATADLPPGNAQAAAHFSVWNTSGGSAGAGTMVVGPARFRSNIHAGDVL
jgi:hypothetical protein